MARGSMWVRVILLTVLHSLTNAMTRQPSSRSAGGSQEAAIYLWQDFVDPSVWKAESPDLTLSCIECLLSNIRPLVYIVSEAKMPINNSCTGCTTGMLGTLPTLASSKSFLMMLLMGSAQVHARSPGQGEGGIPSQEQHLMKCPATSTKGEDCSASAPA